MRLDRAPNILAHLLPLKPISKRAKNRFREHAKLEVIELLGDKLLLRCIDESCKCDHDETATRWLGWFKIGADVAVSCQTP